MKRESDWNQFGRYIVSLIGFDADTLLNGRFVIMQPRVSFEEKDSVHNKKEMGNKQEKNVKY